MRPGFSAIGYNWVKEGFIHLNFSGSVEELSSTHFGGSVGELASTSKYLNRNRFIILYNLEQHLS